MRKQSSQWSDSVRNIVLVLLFIFIIAALWISRGSFSLVIGAALVAYILSPIVRFFTHKLHMNRNLAVVLSYVILLLMLIVIIAVIIPLCFEDINNFFQNDWPMIVENIRVWIDDFIANAHLQKTNIAGFEVDLSKPLMDLSDEITNFNLETINIQEYLPGISGAMKRMLSISTNFVNSIVTTLLLLITAVMTSIHMCKDGGKLGGWFVNLFEDKYRPEIRELLRRLGTIWNNYFAGEIKLMLFIAAASFVLFEIAGIRYAFLLGIIAGLCEVVPQIGPILASIPAILSAAIFGSRWLPFNNFTMVLIAVGISILIQQAENIFIVPRIMGEALDLHPVVIILGIMVLSSKLGLFGALLASPLIGLLKEILHFVMKKIRREDPFPLNSLEDEPVE